MLVARIAALITAVVASVSFAHPAKAGPSLLVDAETGLVMYAEDADLPWYPASLTKLMTAYIVFEDLRDGKLSPEDVLTCSERAHNEPPSKVGLPVGGQVKVDFAIRALIVKSANDIAIMLADKIAGSEAAFVERMNATAKRLGMTNTKFVNPNGLPMMNPDGTEGPRAETSARDMAILARMLIREFPQHQELFTMSQVRMGNKLLLTHNSILRAYEGADGMKTGFICAAGYNVVATASRNGRRLIAVVLGETSGGARTVKAAAMFEHGFQVYPWKAVLAPTLDTLPVMTPEGAKPADMRPVVCRKPVAAARKPKRPQLKPGHRRTAPVQTQGKLRQRKT
jgi:D-alanyl-D-alanine carboxypeptidase